MRPQELLRVGDVQGASPSIPKIFGAWAFKDDLGLIDSRVEVWLGMILEALEAWQVAVARVDERVGGKIIGLPGVQLSNLRHLTALQIVKEWPLPLD
jgi:hypothetical protein